MKNENNNSISVVSYHGSEKPTMKSNSKNKLFLTSAIALLLLLLGVVGVNAGIDCNITSVTTINQNTVLNVSYNVSADASTGNTTVLFELRDTTNHINSSYSVIGNVSNTTGQRWTNMTFVNSIIFPDADNADLRATCYQNASSVLIETATATAISSIVVDRSAPIVQGLSSPATGVSTNLYTATFGVVNSSRWRFFHNSAVIATTSVTSDFSNSSQQTQQISLRDSGSYYVEVSDGTNTTNSATISYTMTGGVIKSTVKEAVKKAAEQKIIKEKKKSNKGILLIGVTFILVIVMVGAMMSPKVRRRKR